MAPIWTMGPSVPADPPEPTVRIEETTFAMPTRLGMAPPFWMMARMTWGTP